MRYASSPYASPAFNGIGQASTPTRYRDVGFDYVFPITLTANQVTQSQQNIDNDADFAWRAVILSAATGEFGVRFSDSDWYYLSSGYMQSANILGDPSSPWPVFPELILPAGGQIGIALIDLSGAENTIEMVFRGAKRYALQ